MEPTEPNSPDRQHRSSQRDFAERTAAARASVLSSARDCVTHAVELALPADASASGLYASDVLFRHMHGCVNEYGRNLRVLGEPADRVRELLRRAVEEALSPNQVHPAVLAAIEMWCDEIIDAE